MAGSLGVVAAAAFGLLLAIGCIGLREFLYAHRPSLAADLGAVFGVLAGLTVMLMLIVQLAIRYPSVITPELTGDPDAFANAQDRIHFGLDVAWDILIAAATLFFSAAALRHPRLGVLYAVSGTLIAVALAVTNLLTFPIPPAGAGSFDVGPAVGLWYVAAAVRTAASMGWVRDQMGMERSPGGSQPDAV
jgi:hypothetical protein